MARSRELEKCSCPLSTNKGQTATQFAPATTSRCVITLDLSQFNYYQQSCIEIHSPDGEYLESIGYEIQKQTQEEQTTQLQEQIISLQSLCEKITLEVELPAQAIAGLGIHCFGLGGLLRGRIDKIGGDFLAALLLHFFASVALRNRLRTN